MALRPRTLRAQDGQASVELVALLPLLAVVGFLLWQAVLAGHAMWSAAGAARSAARAGAIGGEDDAREAARALLPARVARGMRVRPGERGEIVVTVQIPSVFGGAAGTWSSRARMEPQHERLPR